MLEIDKSNFQHQMLSKLRPRDHVIMRRCFSASHEMAPLMLSDD